MLSAQHKSSLTAIASVFLISGCTIYSPTWRQYPDPPSGPVTGGGQPTTLVNRCELVDIRLGSGYRCLDYGFKDTGGDVVRLKNLREELKAAGPQIQQLREAKQQRYSKEVVRYQIFLVAIKPSVYVGVPLPPGEYPRWCGDITCITASWITPQNDRGEAVLIWRERAPVRRGSFWFAPEFSEGPQPLPPDGAPIQPYPAGYQLKLTPKNEFWTLEK